MWWWSKRASQLSRTLHHQKTEPNYGIFKKAGRLKTYDYWNLELQYTRIFQWYHTKTEFKTILNDLEWNPTSFSLKGHLLLT